MGSWMSTAWDPATSIPDISGKVAIITGGNTGIGYPTALELARHGAKVYLACRNETKALDAIERMHKDYPKLEPGKAVWLPLDLADLDSVVKAAETFMSREARLDILVNNAGMAAKKFETTPAGFEIAMGVNHLAHFLLTIKLLPVLERTAEEKSSDVRIVNVSSSAHSMMIPSTLRFDKAADLQYKGVSSSPPYAGTRDLFSRYGVSKLANVLFTTALQKRHQDIICASCNPGPTNTAGGMSVWPGFMQPIMSLLFMPAAVGAKPLMLLAGGMEVANDRGKYKGAYVGSKCKVESPSQTARDKEMAENLYKLSEEALKKWIEI